MELARLFLTKLDRLVSSEDIEVLMVHDLILQNILQMTVMDESDAQCIEKYFPAIRPRKKSQSLGQMNVGR